MRRDVHEEHALDGFDVVFASALLDVLADYERRLESLCSRRTRRWVLLHRQRHRRRPHAEVVPGLSRPADVPLDGDARASWSSSQRGTVAGSSRPVPVEGDVHSFLLAR